MKVFSRILPVLRTEKCESGKVGWISNPSSADDADWWARLLQRKFLSVVEAFVVGEAFLEGSHGEEAITKDLKMNSPFLTADNIRFPPVKSEMDIDLILFGKDPFPVHDAFDGTATVRTNVRTKTFMDLANHGIRAMPELPEPEVAIPELLSDMEERARVQEEEEQRAFTSARAEDREAEEEEGLLPPAPFLPFAAESSVFPQITSHPSPDYYSTELSNQYARANLWGKSEIHLQLLEQEKRRLDTLNFQVYSRIEKIGLEAENIRAQILELEKKHEVLQGLYGTHQTKFTDLEQSNDALQHESAKKYKPSYSSAAALVGVQSHVKKRGSSDLGPFQGGRPKARRVVGLGRLQTSVAKSNLNTISDSTSTPPNPFAMTVTQPLTPKPEVSQDTADSGDGEIKEEARDKTLELMSSADGMIAIDSGSENLEIEGVEDVEEEIDEAEIAGSFNSGD